MKIPNILSEEEKEKLKMLSQKSSSNIKDAIKDEISRVELQKINEQKGDEELEL